MSSPRVLGHVEHNRVHVVVVSPATARDLFFVSTYDTTDPDSNARDKHGYQRPPMPGRFAEIANYFTDNEHQYLITPLIVSVRLRDAQQIDRFMRLLEANDIAAISRTFGRSVASVVDGQHRFLGLVKAWEENSEFQPPIPVVLYFGLDFVDEAELFNTINVTQRKLPKALIETTRGDITEAASASYVQKIRRIAFSLCRDADSVWGPISGVEQINMTGVRDPERPVTYEGLRRSTANMFPVELLERLENLDPDLPVKIAKRYWKRVSEACREAWTGSPATRVESDQEAGEDRVVTIKYRIKDLVGVAALAKLGKDIITSQIEAPLGANRLEGLVEKLVAVDWEKRPGNQWMVSQAGFAGQKDLYHVLHRLVYSGERPEAGIPTLSFDDEE